MIGKFSNFWFKPVPDWRYSIVRVGYAAVSLLHLIELWPYRLSFFSDQGMNSQDAVIASSPTFYLSLFAFLESPAAVTAFFVLAFLAGLSLLLGIFPRASIVITYAFYASFIARVQIGITGMDLIMSNFGFLLLISPLGNASVLQKDKPSPDPAPRYGLVLMQLQVLVIYWQTVFNRLDDEYWRRGDFFYYFVQSAYSRVPGTWAIDASPGLRYVTWGIQVLEFSIPLLLFFRKTVWGGIVLGILLHLSIALVTRHLFLFSITMLMTYLCFVPSLPFREPVLALLRSRGKRDNGGRPSKESVNPGK